MSLFVVSCAYQEMLISDIDQTFYAEIEQPSPSDLTKTYYDTDSDKVLWDNGDLLTMFTGTSAPLQYRFAGGTGVTGGKLILTDGSGASSGDAISHNYAVYPYSEDNGLDGNENIVVKTSGIQTYPGFDSFGENDNIMVAASDNTSFSFKNVCGWIIFGLTGTGQVSSITLKGNNDEIIAGDLAITMTVGGDPTVAPRVKGTKFTNLKEITLTCPDPVTLSSTATDFWIAVPQTTFSGGFTFTVTDPYGRTCTKSLTSNYEVQRSKYRRIATYITYDVEADMVSRLSKVYDFLYDGFNGVRPHTHIANNPSLEMQADGWDAEMTTHSWGVEAKSGFFENLWKLTYKMIDSVNEYLSVLKEVDPDTVSEDKRNTFEGEARGLRGYCYYVLTSNFGPVPMRMTGETRESVPAKARPETDDEAWEMILEDLEFSAAVLDWTPYNGETGHFTKAAALAYAAKAHMYKGEFAEAAAEYRQIIDGSGKKLNPVHGMLHWPNNPDSEETIWEISYPEYPKMDWGAGSYASAGKLIFLPMQYKPDEYGGWGDSSVSYEHVRSYESGDKRLMYNIQAWWGDHGDKHPYFGWQDGGVLSDNYAIGNSERHRDYFQSTRSGIPNAHSIKWWKYNNVYAPYSLQLYRYTGVLLDYAECCFETGDMATGWNIINQVRNRAWGNLEVGYNPNVTNRGAASHPFPTGLLNTQIVEVPDAQIAYTAYKTEKGYSMDVWKVALLQERRKEFLQEFSFWYDLCRMDVVQEWLDCEYPVNGGAHWYNTVTKQFIMDSNTDFNHAYMVAIDEDKANMIPVTYRDWNWDPIHKRYPIPTSELTTNNLCTQNPGY